LRVATDAPIDFAVGVLQAALSALTFIAVLWTIGGALNISIGGRQPDDPGLSGLCGGALCRAGQRRDDGGRQQVRLGIGSQEPDRADYRYQLTRVRENGESIALLGGEEEERAGINRSLAAVAVALARTLSPAHEDDDRIAGFLADRTGYPF